MRNIPMNKRNGKRMRKESVKNLIVRIVAGIAVFCTVCSLCMPVFAVNSTQEFSDTDKKVLHTHNEFCIDSKGNLICTLPELKEHRHSDACYETPVQETEPEKELHIHSDDCYRQKRGSLICVVTEEIEHVHTDDCYETVVQETVPEEVPHEHTDACYTREKGELTCIIPVREGHSHGESCYGVGTEPVCETEESETHSHTDACYDQYLNCELAEDAGHSHSDDCYAWNEILSCNQEEITAVQEPTEAVEPEKKLVCTQKDKTLYIHADSCYEAGTDLVCGIIGNPEHTHTDDCYVQILVCGRPKACEHIHEDSCYEWMKVLYCDMEEWSPADEEPTEPTESEKILICTQKELINHHHTASCYNTDAAGKESIICGQVQMEAHQHVEACLDFAEFEPVCEREENETHKHDYHCYSSWSFLCQKTDDFVEDPTEAPTEEPTEAPTEVPTLKPDSAQNNEPESDPTADLEKRSTWEKTFSHVELTGAWSHDLLAIAKTQLGYEESERNYLDCGETKKGYTRYGAWYGDRYGHWCAMFVSFCLHYAEIEGFPLHHNCTYWIRELEKIDMYATADTYTPKPGDIIFFDNRRKVTTPEWVAVDANHVGIVAQVIPATEEEPAQIITIEGNKQNSVCEDRYSADDPRIIGYGLLPDGPAAVYSCGMEKHLHEAACYEVEDNAGCQVQEHIHNEICRSRNLHYADDSMWVNVVLTNAVYLPEDLSLRIEMVPEEETGAYRKMLSANGSTPQEESKLVEDVLVYRMKLLADGQPYQQALGVQADVQISFASTLFVPDAVKPETYILIEVDSEDSHSEQTMKQTRRFAESQSCRVERAAADIYEVSDEGISSLFFVTGSISDFAIIFSKELN